MFNIHIYLYSKREFNYLLYISSLVYLLRDLKIIFSFSTDAAVVYEGVLPPKRKENNLTNVLNQIIYKGQSCRDDYQSPILVICSGFPVVLRFRFPAQLVLFFQQKSTVASLGRGYGYLHPGRAAPHDDIFELCGGGHVIFAVPAFLTKIRVHRCSSRYARRWRSCIG